MYARGTQWVSLKAGYAKAAVEDAADGNLGFGVAYTYFLGRKWSVGLAGHYEVLGRYQGPAEVEIPVTVETAYHFKWPTQASPYLGAGTGPFFHSYKFTGDDSQETRWSHYVLGGMNFPITSRALVGADLRMVIQSGAKSDNPWFPSPDNTVIHWSAKVGYSYGF